MKGGGVVNATPRPFYPRERPITHCAGCWLGPHGRTGRVQKTWPPPAFDTRTVQPVASRYTDCAIAAPHYICINYIILTEIVFVMEWR